MISIALSNLDVTSSRWFSAGAGDARPSCLNRPPDYSPIARRMSSPRIACREAAIPKSPSPHLQANFCGPRRQSAAHNPHRLSSRPAVPCNRVSTTPPQREVRGTIVGGWRRRNLVIVRRIRIISSRIPYRTRVTIRGIEHASDRMRCVQTTLHSLCRVERGARRTKVLARQHNSPPPSACCAARAHAAPARPS